MSLCDSCNINTATIHIVQILNGKKLTSHLCKQCAIKEMHIHAGDITVDKLLAGMMKPLISDEGPQLKCKECGTEFSKFSLTGRVGCKNCYKEFMPYIEQMLTKSQKSLEHIGRQPDINTSEHTEQVTRLRSLRREMRGAIEIEDFERAAEIRDEIAEIKV